MATLTPIPQPPKIPFLGNATLIDSELPTRSFSLLAKQYGEIYQLEVGISSPIVHLNSAALVRQVSDDTRFKKPISRTMNEVRVLAGDGLASASQDEPNWGIARKSFKKALFPSIPTNKVIQIAFLYPRSML